MSKLSELEVNEISLVDDGANPGAQVVFFKRKEEKRMEDKTIDVEQSALQERVAELEKTLSEREAADKAELEKVAEEKIAADHAEVTALYERLNKRLEEHIEKAETSELKKIASKYEVLGEKADELASVLKKAKGTDLYDKIISNLDRELAIVEKQGLYEEIGKSQNATNNVEEVAKRIQQSEPKLTWRQALDRAYQSNPEWQV